VGQILGRVDEPVAGGMAHKVAVAAVRFRRVVAAIVDAVLDRQGKIVLHLVGVITADGADRAGRTGEEGTRGRPSLGIALGLAAHKGKVVRLAERVRRELSAGVTVDAGGIDEEIACHVQRQALHSISHAHSPRRWVSSAVILPWSDNGVDLPFAERYSAR